MLDTRRLLLVLLTVPALTFAACGDDKDSGTSSGDGDKDAITAIIEEGGTNPSSVCNHLDAATLEGMGGADACVEASKAEAPDDTTEIKSLKVDGETAIAEVTDKDGPQTINFVKVDGDWKVNVSGAKGSSGSASG
jgi:hypothetical protein